MRWGPLILMVCNGYRSKWVEYTTGMCWPLGNLGQFPKGRSSPGRSRPTYIISTIYFDYMVERSPSGLCASVFSVMSLWGKLLVKIAARQVLLFSAKAFPSKRMLELKWLTKHKGKLQENKILF